MPLERIIVQCSWPTCTKSMLKSSLKKHRIEVHGEVIAPEVQKYIEPKPVVEIIPFAKIDDKDPTKILLKKIEGCRKDFNGTKSAMQLYFEFKECELLIECVKEVLRRKEEVLA